MNIFSYSEIKIRINSDIHWVLYTDGNRNIPGSEYTDIIENICGLPDSNGKISFNNEHRTVGISPFSILENTIYRWEFEPIEKNKFPALNPKSINKENIKNKMNWNPGRNGLYGDFNIKNYLGSSYIHIDNNPNGEFYFLFDVISEKIDYYSEYRNLVESIAEQCSQLLLEWDSPTDFNFSPDKIQDGRIILEKFLFLRNVLKPENLQLYLEIINRNPDNILADESNWKPIGTGFDTAFFTNPLKNGRDWQKNVNLPSEILVYNRYETNDTPANRFIKFALTEFNNVCQKVIENLEGDEKLYSTAAMEARNMSETLDIFLSQPFFKDAGKLNNIPYNSQILQKREGYRQILHAWLMMEAASALDWYGREDFYKGSNRNAAILYEYWVFFILFAILKNTNGLKYKPSIKKNENNIPDFISYGNNGMTINLKGGESSKASFSGNTISVNLYYNRQFNADKKAISGKSSYSKIFRPDYSLVLFPALKDDNTEMNEDEAEKLGLIAWIHFDAKYRIDKYNKVFGEKENKSELKNDKNDDLDIGSFNLDEEKDESAYSVYKRGDLYKMHTYNEAIRRTAGSYVIYPGTDNGGKTFEKYHELLPGVGAFPLRPSNDDPAIVNGTDTLKSFIESVIEHQVDRYTDYYRMNYWTNNTIVRDNHSDYMNIKDITKPPRDINVALVPVLNDEIYHRCIQDSFFYCDAVLLGENEYLTYKEIMQSEYILPVKMNVPSTYNCLFKIKSIELISKESLINKLGLVHSEFKSMIYYLIIIEYDALFNKKIKESFDCKKTKTPYFITLDKLKQCLIS